MSTSDSTRRLAVSGSGLGVHACRVNSRSRGITLIELVLFIVVVGVGIAGSLLAYEYAAKRSVDPIVKKQALAIAESLLEEIQQMPFTYCDPDDPNVTTATSAADCSIPELPGPETQLDGLEKRGIAGAPPFDNVNDYNGYTMAGGITDVTGAPITGLGAYSAAVTVAPATLGTVPNTDALRITVTVTGPTNVTVTLDGYRTQYAPNLCGVAPC